jgi:hypothetical protein
MVTLVTMKSANIPRHRKRLRIYCLAAPACGRHLMVQAVGKQLAEFRAAYCMQYLAEPAKRCGWESLVVQYRLLGRRGLGGLALIALCIGCLVSMRVCRTRV